jgi:hypothetical protein
MRPPQREGVKRGHVTVVTVNGCSEEERRKMNLEKGSKGFCLAPARDNGDCSLRTAVYGDNGDTRPLFLGGCESSSRLSLSPSVTVCHRL